MSAGHPPPQRAHIQSEIRADEAEAGLEEGFHAVPEDRRPDSPGLGSSSSDLAERLAPVALDRASSAARIVQETASLLRGWIRDQPHETVLDGRDLERRLSAWADDQAWRGPCALWLDSLRRAWRAGVAADPERAGGLLAEELECWLRIDERDARSDLDPHSEPASPWNGEPLAPGRRLPSRRDLAERARRDLEPGECVLVTSWSETIALSLEAAWRAGLRPEVFVGEGSPDLDGRRMARRLARAGIAVTMVYDNAVPALAPRVDRVWLSTEAIGAGIFLARKGTRTLLEECARRDVPVRVLATSDKLVPGGALRLPAWCERETWLLWEDAPEGVRLEPQVFETVPIELVELVGGFLTEIGRETAADLHLRSLRVEAAPACAGPMIRAEPRAADVIPETRT
jgi:hypothetical protein